MINELAPVLAYLERRIAQAETEIEVAKTWTDAARGAILRSHLRQARMHLKTVEREFDQQPQPAAQPHPYDPLVNDYTGSTR